MSIQKTFLQGFAIKNPYILAALGTGLFLGASILWVAGLIVLAPVYDAIDSLRLKVALALIIHLVLTSAVIGSTLRLMGHAKAFQVSTLGAALGMLGYIGITLGLNAMNVLDGIVGTLLVSFAITMVIVYFSLLGSLIILKKLQNPSLAWGAAIAITVIYVAAVLLSGDSI